MATALGEPPSTVMSWKRKGEIPRWRRQFVADRAAELGIDLEGCDLSILAPDTSPGESAAA